MNLRRVKFPSDHSLGRLFLTNRQSPANWLEIGEAQGVVEIPADRILSLWISNEGLSYLAQLSHLSADAVDHVLLATTRVKDADLTHLCPLRGLTGLALWETHISNAALPHLEILPALRWLDVGDTRVTDDGLLHLQSLPALGELTLTNTCISDAGLPQLLHLPALRSLGLADTPISDTGISHLYKMTKLRRLDLLNTAITDACIEVLKQLTNLQSLRIFQTQITPSGYAELQRALPHCQIRYFHPHQVMNQEEAKSDEWLQLGRKLNVLTKSRSE